MDKAITFEIPEGREWCPSMYLSELTGRDLDQACGAVQQAILAVPRGGCRCSRARGWKAIIRGLMVTVRHN